MLFLSSKRYLLLPPLSSTPFVIWLLWFAGLPSNFHEDSYVPPHEAPCILAELCRSHDGILLEAKGIREYWWNNLMDKLFEKSVSQQLLY